MAQVPLEITIRARDEASGILERFKQQTDDVVSSFNNLNPAIKGAMSALSAYAGARGLLGIIKASDDAAQAQAQAKFFLRGFTTDVNGALQQIREYGRELQLTSGIGINEFTVTTAKLANRVKDTNKAIGYSNTLFKLQRLGLVNASQASNMLLRAQDGNTRALRFFLEQLGFAIPEFASLETIFANLEAQINGLQSELGPFATQWAAMKGVFMDIVEKAGKPVSEFFGSILTFLNQILANTPILKDFVGIILIVGTAFLAFAGILFFLKPVIGGFIAIFGALSVPIIALIATIVFAMFIFGKMGLTIKDVISLIGESIRLLATQPIAYIKGFLSELVGSFQTSFGKVVGIVLGAGLAILAMIAFFAGGWVVAIALALAGIVFMVISSWEEIKGFFTDSMNAIHSNLKAGMMTLQLEWNEFLEFMKFLWTNAWDTMISNVKGAVNVIIGFINKLISAWNGISFTVPRVSIPFVGTFGGQTIGVMKIPEIPTLQQGGIVRKPTLVMAGEAGAEAIVPLNRGLGSTINLTITGNTFMSDEQTALRIGDMILQRVKVLQKFGLD